MITVKSSLDHGIERSRCADVNLMASSSYVSRVMRPGSGVAINSSGTTRSYTPMSTGNMVSGAADDGLIAGLSLVASGLEDNDDADDVG